MVVALTIAPGTQLAFCFIHSFGGVCPLCAESPWHSLLRGVCTWCGDALHLLYWAGQSLGLPAGWCRSDGCDITGDCSQWELSAGTSSSCQPGNEAVVVVTSFRTGHNGTCHQGYPQAASAPLQLDLGNWQVVMQGKGWAGWGTRVMPRGVSNPEGDLSAQRDFEDVLGASSLLPPDELPFLSPPSGHVLAIDTVSASAGCPACPEASPKRPGHGQKNAGA